MKIQKEWSSGEMEANAVKKRSRLNSHKYYFEELNNSVCFGYNH